MSRLIPGFKVKYLIYAVVTVLFGYALYTYRDYLFETAAVLRSGIWYLILLSLFVLAGALINQAALYASLYRVFGITRGKKRILLPLYLVHRFAIVAAPSGGLSGWVPFIHDARQRGLGVGKVLIANLVYMILWYSAVSIFLVTGLVQLLILKDLTWFEVGATLMLLGIDAAMVAMLILAGYAPNVLQKLLAIFRQLLTAVYNWFKRPAPIRPEQIDRFSSDLKSTAMQIRQFGLRSLLRPVGHALFNEFLHLMIFFILARAFGLDLSPGVIVAAYSISMLFYIISPTPGGIGIVEGVLVLVLTSLGTRQADATGLTIAFRGITFWLPFLLGFFALRWTEHTAPSKP